MRQPAVVLLVPPASAREPIWTSVIEAIRAQVADAPLELRVREVDDLGRDLAAQFAIASELARGEDLRGVFWIRIDPAGDVLVYLVEPTGQRALVRRIQGGPESREAALESAALIVRAQALALVDGQVIGLHAPAPVVHPTAAPRPAAAPAPAPRPRQAALLRVAYLGSNYAASTPWLSGLALAVGWQGGRGARVVVGYDVLPPIGAEAGGVEIDVRRHPARLEAGYARRFGRFQVAGALGVELDPVVRRARAQVEGVNAAIPETTLVVGIVPTFAAGFSPVPWLVLHAGLGLSGHPNNVQYFAETPDRVEVLAPHPVRARAEIGLEFVLGAGKNRPAAGRSGHPRPR